VQAIWRKSLALDLPVLLVPEAYGGVGHSDLAAALVLDILASACAGVASVFACHFAATAAARESGTSELNAYFSEDTDFPAAIVFPEEMEETPLKMIQRGSDVILSGQSTPAGNAAMAGMFLVCAYGNESPGNISLCSVPHGLPGVEIDTPLDLPGLKVNKFAKIRFQNAAIADGSLAAKLSRGDGPVDPPRKAYYGFIAAMAMGVARKAMDLAVAYAKERYQYGRKIIGHQEIQRMLGAMKMKLGIGTAGYLRLFDADHINLPHFPADARLVKAFCSDMAMEIVMDAIQIHGGYGYMHEYGLEKMMRDVKILQLMGGRNPHHQLRVIAGDV
jgi:alkylation response protein AidB-like acyl-CoA dehydrogenase